MHLIPLISLRKYNCICHWFHAAILWVFTETNWITVNQGNRRFPSLIHDCSHEEDPLTMCAVSFGCPDEAVSCFGWSVCSLSECSGLRWAFPMSYSLSKIINSLETNQICFCVIIDDIIFDCHKSTCHRKVGFVSGNDDHTYSSVNDIQSC